MKTLVIYDSVFGNTEKIAQSIAAALDIGHPIINGRLTGFYKL
jgi:flavodoxin